MLKDAASAAIYGSRATNGVVLITTKQGREGKSEVKVNYGFSITQFPNTGRREYVGSKQYVEVFNEGVDNYNRQNGFTVNSSGYVKPIRNPYGDMPDTDWLDLITRLGQSHYLDLSFSGGNAKTKYYLSGSYNYQEGVIKTNDISKVNLKSNINHEMFKWLKVGANISGNYLHNNRIPGADLGSTIIGRAVQQRPFDRPYKPNGGYYTGGTDELLLHQCPCRFSPRRPPIRTTTASSVRSGRGADHQGADGQGVVQQRLGLHLRLHLLQSEPPLCCRQGPHPGPEPVRDDQHDRPLRQL